jgi:hypothetical protein
VIGNQNVVVRAAVAALALVVATGVASEALAAKEKSTQTEARWVKFDAAKNTVAVKVQDPGNGPNKKLMKKGAEVLFNVVPEGSILTRTTVAINGKPGNLKDIPPGKQVNVYWIPDPKKAGEFFARKIDVVLSDEELDARYGTE